MNSRSGFVNPIVCAEREICYGMIFLYFVVVRLHGDMKFITKQVYRFERYKGLESFAEPTIQRYKDS